MLQKQLLKASFMHTIVSNSIRSLSFLVRQKPKI